MAPIENTVQVQGDITKQSTVDKILEIFNKEKSDLVVCDGAPDVTGFHDIDQYIQCQLLVAALNIANLVLKEKGTFIAKVFKGKDTMFLYSQFKVFFNKVIIMKPKSSRKSSVESFIVCLEYNPPKSFLPKKLSAFEEFENLKEDESSDEEKKLYNFVTCGDLSGFDK